MCGSTVSSSTSRCVMRPTTPSHHLAVVIPCFNVETEVAAVIRSLPPWVAHIIAVDDHSADGTLGLLEELTTQDARLLVIPRESNGGVGAATVTGYRLALAIGATIIVKMDGDGQMDAAQLPRLLRPLVEGRADYAKGNRFRHVEELERMPRTRLFGNVALTFMTRMVSGYWRVADAQNGFTAISREALGALPLARLDSSYTFENSMLTLLNIDERPVVDVAMPAIYGDERSSMRIPAVVVTFPLKLCRMLVYRLLVKYLLYDGSPIACYTLSGVLLLCFGSALGGHQWWRSLRTCIPPTGTTLVSSLLLLLLGYFLTRKGINLDIARTPRPREPEVEVEVDDVCQHFRRSRQ